MFVTYERGSGRMDVKHEIREMMTSWDRAMEAGDRSALREIVDQVIRIMSDGIYDKRYGDLYFLFQSGAGKIEAWGNLLDIDTEDSGCRIFAYAIFWMAHKMSKELDQRHVSESSANEKYEEISAGIRNTKYLNVLLELLNEHGDLPQNAIAAHLSISSNALSNFLRRNEKYELWDHKKYGKYNYYYLTDQGKKFLSSCQERKIEKDSNNVKQLLLYFLECFADEMEKDFPDVESIVHKVNKKLGGGKAVFGDEADKLAIRKAMRKIKRIARWREIESSRRLFDERISIECSETEGYVDYSEEEWDDGRIAVYGIV